MTDFISFGIDPGSTGSLAAIDSHGQLVALHDMPIGRDGKVSWVESNELAGFMMAARGGRPAHIWLERAQAMPRQGVVSMFNYGMAFGATLAACQRLAIPLHLIAASTWKSAMGLSKDKAASVNRAKLIFPTADLSLKKHHNRAEGLMLAEYGRRQYASQGAV